MTISLPLSITISNPLALSVYLSEKALLKRELLDSPFGKLIFTHKLIEI